MFFKKAQVSYADFLIGLLILIVITFIFTITIIDLNSREDKIQELINDGSSISNSFMSPAYNKDKWNQNPPKGRLGFVKDGKLIKEDFDTFLNLLNSQEGYKKSKILLGAKKDYVLYFEYGNDKIRYNNIEVFGKYDDVKKINADNLLRINRIVYYDLDGGGKGNIVKMVVLVF